MSATIAPPETQEQTKKDVRILPPYNVILLNDEDHSFQYVIQMLRKIFGYNQQDAERMTQEVDKQGRCIVWTGAKEYAEAKQEQIHNHGADRLMPNCKGSMSAVIEPAV